MKSLYDYVKTQPILSKDSVPLYQNDKFTMIGQEHNGIFEIIYLSDTDIEISWKEGRAKGGRKNRIFYNACHKWIKYEE